METIDARLSRLYDRLERPDTSAAQAEVLARKIELLQRQRD